MTTPDKSALLDMFRRKEIDLWKLIEPERKNWLRTLSGLAGRFGTCRTIAKCRASEALYGTVEYYLRRHEVLANKVNPLGFFFWKCKNMLVDVYRREVPMKGTHVEVEDMDSLAAVSSLGSEYDYDLKRRMLEKRLAPKQKAVLLKHLEGAEDGDIAEELRMLHATVRSTLFKAKRNSRRILQELES